MDAVFRAIGELMDIPVTLVEYTIGAVTGGADALGEVRVVVESRRPHLRQPGRLHRHHPGLGGGLPARVLPRQAATEPEQELAGV